MYSIVCCKFVIAFLIFQPPPEVACPIALLTFYNCSMPRFQLRISPASSLKQRAFRNCLHMNLCCTCARVCLCIYSWYLGSIVCLQIFLLKIIVKCQSLHSGGFIQWHIKHCHFSDCFSSRNYSQTLLYGHPLTPHYYRHTFFLHSTGGKPEISSKIHVFLFIRISCFGYLTSQWGNNFPLISIFFSPFWVMLKFPLLFD